MPVTEQTPVVTHNGNGVTTVFAYNYKILAAADMEVTVDGVVKTLTTDYSVSGVGVDGGGSVTMVVAPPSGTDNVILRRNMAYSRSNDYQDNGDLLAATADEDADRPIMMVQQLVADIARAMKLPVGVTTDQVIAGSAAEREGKLVSFDSSGNMMLAAPADFSLTTVSAFIATLLDDADAAAARATLGIGTSDLLLSAGKVIVFEGATDDAFETTLSANDPTADRSITLPDQGGTVKVMARGSDIASAGTINLTTATGDIVDVTGTTAITAITLADGIERTVRFTGALTLTHGASLVLPSAANISTAAGDIATFRGYAAGVVRCTAYQKASGQAVVSGGGSTGTPDATTSGTARDFTSLPSTARMIVIWGKGVSTNGTALYLLQLGDSGGIETSGYTGNTAGVNSAGAGLGTAFRTDGISLLSTSASAAADTHDFVCILTLVDPANNTWAWQMSCLQAANRTMWGVGQKSTSAALDRVRLTTVGATDTFDAGTWNWVSFN